MQGNDIALRKHLFEWRIKAALLGTALAGRESYAHAQRPADTGHGLPQRALADDAQGRARQIFDGIIKITELLRSVPQHRFDRDRKSVVSGKRVSVLVDLGGRRIVQKKK